MDLDIQAIADATGDFSCFTYGRSRGGGALNQDSADLDGGATAAQTSPLDGRVSEWGALMENGESSGLNCITTSPVPSQVMRSVRSGFGHVVSSPRTSECVDSLPHEHAGTSSAARSVIEASVRKRVNSALPASCPT